MSLWAQEIGTGCWLMRDKATYAIFKLGAILVRVITFRHATDCKTILQRLERCKS